MKTVGAWISFVPGSAIGPGFTSTGRSGLSEGLAVWALGLGLRVQGFTGFGGLKRLGLLGLGHGDV